MKPLDLGVSSYIPSDNETVLFRSMTFSTDKGGAEGHEDL